MVKPRRDWSFLSPATRKRRKRITRRAYPLAWHNIACRHKSYNLTLICDTAKTSCPNSDRTTNKEIIRILFASIFTAVMPSISPHRGRSRSRSNLPDADGSPTAIRERSPPRRSISPRSDSRSRSPSRTKDPPRHDSRRNGARNGRSRTRSYSRSLSRGRSYSRSLSRGSPVPRSSKVDPTLLLDPWQ